MTHTLTPVPPATQRHNLGKKVLILLGVAFFCIIPTIFISELTYNREYYQTPTVPAGETTDTAALSAEQTQLLQDYQAINRATKYAILFIVLTFSLFFLFEVLGGTQLHPINYGLIGLALAVFYLLLLSVSEHIGFTPAYGLAATAVIGLIISYVHGQLLVRQAQLLTLLLVGLYGYLFILLQLETYSLLFGSLLVFATLTTIMLSTRHINWYET